MEGSIGCHLSVHEKSESLFYANYWTGDFGVFSCKDGKFLKEIQHLRHSGSGPNAERQEGPHPHGVFIDPSGTRLLVPGLF